MARPVACLGAGRMGRGLAHALAWAGREVRLLDVKRRDEAGFAALEAAALSEIREGLEMRAGFGALDAEAIPRLTARVSIHPRGSAPETLTGAEFVFEGVPEQREPKADAFALFDAHGEPDAILASTTSSFLSTMLAELTARPESALNAHWLNPAFLMPLVEISPSDRTADETTRRTLAFLEDVGKVPVLCAASPGYIVPRIQALAMNEAARLVEEGVASAEDVDKAVTYGFGLRFAVLGLLEFIDWGGCDILHHAGSYMAEATGRDGFAPPEIVRRHMAEGRIGFRTGSGFLDYEGLDLDAHRRRRLAAFERMAREAGLAHPPALDDDSA